MSRWLAALLLPLALAPAVSAQANAKGTTRVFMIAVSEYDSESLPKLPFTVRESEEFRQVLVRSGIKAEDITFMRDPEGKADKHLAPTLKNINKQLNIFLARVESADTLIVVLNGHGVMPNAKIGYFCPADADLSDTKTLFPLEGEGGLYARLQAAKCARQLMLVSACRNDTSDSSQATNKVPPVNKDYKFAPPKGIAAIFSCQSGEKTFYFPPVDQNPKSRALKRGLFFHHLIEAWDGKYADKGQAVTLEDIFREVRKRTSHDADEIHHQPQNPVIQRAYDQEWIILPAGKIRPPAAVVSNPKEPPPATPPTKPEPPSDANAPPPPLLMSHTSLSAASVKKAQADWAKHLGLPAVNAEMVESPKMEFVLVPPGTYQVGRNKVTITRPFYMSATEVTQKQYAALTGENPSKFNKGGPRPDSSLSGVTSTDDFPVETVTHAQALAFAEKLAGSVRLSGKFEVNLPTEAEWEWACRAGTVGAFGTGDSLSGAANFRVGSGGFNDRTAAVASRKKPNALGLHDMHGNVAEWCRDRFAEIQGNAGVEDPLQEKGTDFVVRGGSYRDSELNCRSEARHKYGPDYSGANVGFRVVVVIGEKK